MKIPEPENSIQSLIDRFHASHSEPPRPHMGCSQLGHPCDRWLWLSFRWAVGPEFPGRILRLFRRGHREEETIVSDLRAIGVDVTHTGSHQVRVDFGAHVSGSVDAIIDSGVPEAPKKKHIAEFKTHSLKSFNAVAAQGVEKSKPEHFIQMQTYMHGQKIDRALYVAVCKDDDRIYTERVRYDKEIAEKAIQRGKRIALADNMPAPVSSDPSWYQCKFCAAHSFCMETRLTQEVNCRTCAHSSPREDSTWHCARYETSDIPVEFQRSGCECHVLHPDLVPWEMKCGPDKWTAVYVINGREVANGEGDARIYTSKEILANPQACAAGDEYVGELRDVLGARVVG